MSTANGGAVLKACQTCYNAKIRCIRTRDSPSCDRCVRLGKTCFLNPSRRDRVRQARSRSRGRSRSMASRLNEPRRPREEAVRSLPSSHAPAAESPHDPFDRGLLSLEAGQTLLDYFATKMLAHFPFVVLPQPLSPSTLMRSRPCVCLAALAAAAHRQVALQTSLGRLFNDVVASRVTVGPFHSLDLLQGLLIHVAWAHYQPRPRMHTQHLFLANSIICDMRLDQPEKPKIWNVDGPKDLSNSTTDYGMLEEKRALAGAYYLSSSSSILLEKSQYFAFTPYISRVCEELAQKREGHVPTDNHLRYIVQLQRLIGEVNETAARGSLEPPSREEAAAILQRVKQAGDNIKATLPFPQSDSPLILMQLNLLELLLSQMTSSGGPFGLDRFADAADSQVRPAEENHATLVNWLSTSISAARSLVSAILVLPPGEEGAVSNIEWIATQCALSLAVRLDLVAAYGSASESTRHLGRFLDMPHTLRHIVMRLESAASSDVDATGDRDTFYHLAHRARRLESWCLRRHEQAKVHAARRETRGDGSRQSGTTSEEPRGMDPRSDTASVMASFPSVTNDGNETWNPSVNWDGDDSEMTPMGDFLFSDLLQFPTDFGFSQS